MLLNKFALKSLMFLALAGFSFPSVHASTITVTPSEAQKQIQAAINNSHTGDIIAFQAGTYNLSQLSLVAGRSYIGATNGSTIVHGTGGYALMDFYGSGLTVQHITFDGGGLYLGGGASNVNVEYNTFQNITFGPNATSEWGNWTSTNGVFIESATKLDISYNTFHNISAQILAQYVDHNLGVSGIFGYNLVNTTITYNTFDTLNEGVKFFSGKNVQIDHNTITHFHRMGIEVQDNMPALEIGFNTFSTPLTPFWNTFGISNAIEGNSYIHGNLIQDQTPKACGSACWIGYGIEAWGQGTIVENNIIEGYWGTGVTIGPSTNLQVIGNSICGVSMSAPGAGYVDNEGNTKWPGETISGNTTSSALVCPK